MKAARSSVTFSRESAACIAAAQASSRSAASPGGDADQRLPHKHGGAGRGEVPESEVGYLSPRFGHVARDGSGAGADTMPGPPPKAPTWSPMKCPGHPMPHASRICSAQPVSVSPAMPATKTAIPPRSVRQRQGLAHGARRVADAFLHAVPSGVATAVLGESEKGSRAAQCQCKRARSTAVHRQKDRACQRGTPEASGGRARLPAPLCVAPPESSVSERLPGASAPCSQTSGGEQLLIRWMESSRPAQGSPGGRRSGAGGNDTGIGAGARLPIRRGCGIGGRVDRPDPFWARTDTECLVLPEQPPRRHGSVPAPC